MKTTTPVTLALLALLAAARAKTAAAPKVTPEPDSPGLACYDTGMEKVECSAGQCCVKKSRLRAGGGSAVVYRGCAEAEDCAGVCEEAGGGILLCTCLTELCNGHEGIAGEPLMCWRDGDRELCRRPGHACCLLAANATGHRIGLGCGRRDLCRRLHTTGTMKGGKRCLLGWKALLSKTTEDGDEATFRYRELCKTASVEVRAARRMEAAQGAAATAAATAALLLATALLHLH